MYAKKSMRRCAVIDGSSCRTVPAVKLRGLANTESPCRSRSSFNLRKAASCISISPRTSKSGGIPAFFNLSFKIDNGMERTVRTFSVTSSPTPRPIGQFFFGVSVVEGEHGRGMLSFDESLARLASHALRRRVRRNQRRMLRLEPLELVHQRVEIGVRDLRIVQHVIAILVVPNLLAQSFDLFLDGGTGHDWGIIVRRGSC